MKVRPYELAIEADRLNKTVVEQLQAAGIPVRNYMTVIAPEDVPRARAALGLPAEPPPPTPAPAFRMPVRRGTLGEP